VVREVSGTTVGRKRIMTFRPATVTSFVVYLTDARGNDNVIGVAAYLIDEKLIEK
jgi:alpha-L-fucosidase